MLTRTNLYLTIFFFICLFFSANAQENSEKKRNLFADKIIHSFGFQFNGTLHTKGKFEYKDAAAYQMAGHPCFSLGREYIGKYNLTFPSGWGITTEFVAGNRDFMVYFINEKTGRRHYTHFLNGASLGPFFDYTYYGGQIKASYMYRFHERITLQAETGIKLLKYLRGRGWGHILYTIIDDEYGNPIIVDAWRWFDVSDQYLPERFMPELTAGINFLFHTKKDPRHNFIVGINGTLGFLDRFAGWQWFAPSDEYDVLMKWGSSFFALNMGYEFTGFKKPLYKTKQNKKENVPFETFDFSKPVHSVAAYFTSGFSFNARMKDAQGEISPISGLSFVPEFNIKYSLSIKNGLGFAVEIPIGSFRRTSHYYLGMFIPEDTIWADGKAKGAGFPSSIGVRTPYVGLTLKFSYLVPIHKNMFIQPEAGIKFMPFVFPANRWGVDEEGVDHIYYLDENGQSDVIWMKDKFSISQKNYAVPDITMAVNFMVHGKKPHHNFIFGINANIGLVDRFSNKYHTTDIIPPHLQSSGKYGWKSSYIGFHIGYQWMTGKK